MEEQPKIEELADNPEPGPTLVVSAEGKLVAAATEDSAAKTQSIRELKREIREATAAQVRIKNFQEYYNVPDLMLTETDAALKKTSLSKLQEELVRLQEEKKSKLSPIKKALRKAAAFFRF